jgi:DNA-binding transcriptional ArsR family regulator
VRLFHKALADVNRLRIVRRLAAGPATVRDLIEHVGLSQPLVSWHLGRLRAAGLVATRRSGRETVCSFRSEAFDVQVARERALLGLPPTGRASVDAAVGATSDLSQARPAAADA